MRTDITPWTVRGMGLAFGALLVYGIVQLGIAAGSVLILLLVSILVASGLTPMIGVIRTRTHLVAGRRSFSCTQRSSARSSCCH